MFFKELITNIDYATINFRRDKNSAEKKQLNYSTKFQYFFYYNEF